MNVLIVGATGTLGRQVARCALDEGHRVRCLVRSFPKAAFLKEWGAELVRANLCYPDTLAPALEGMDVVIDAATARTTDSIQVVDWQGKVALIQAAQAANIQRFIFFSIMNAELYPHVPLMEVKRCTELFLQESGLNYTILRPCGFLQGLIGQYAIPILDKQAVWVTGESSPIAYMDTQDIAKFAVKALMIPATECQSFPVVGTRSWQSDEIIQICEKLSGQDARVTRVPVGLIQLVEKAARWFQWSWNVADRLAFSEVLTSGKPMDAPMDDVYATFGLNKADMTTLESYLQEYFTRIQRKLRELDYEKEKQNKKKKQKKTPFKSKSSD